MMKNIWDAMCRQMAFNLSWIETDSGDIGEVSTRGMGIEYTESLEGHPGLRTGSKTRREMM